MAEKLIDTMDPESAIAACRDRISLLAETLSQPDKLTKNGKYGLTSILFSIEEDLTAALDRMGGEAC